ncbi:hypothetical protein A2U01_0081327 [Trifolium medium]|uniref:Uncharacterized protein n=1 Tax=Trifolium medium TaxID=97028 RepID=A0A392TGL1_9FABA|nr:hypothetical protein [Trifolium medium]
MSSDKRKTLQIRAQLPDMKSVKILNGKLTSITLLLRYGEILDLLNAPVQIEVITALTQF